MIDEQKKREGEVEHTSSRRKIIWERMNYGFVIFFKYY